MKMKQARGSGRSIHLGRLILALVLAFLWLGSKSFDLYDSATLLTKSWAPLALVGLTVVLWLALWGLETAVCRVPITRGAKKTSFWDRHVFVLSFCAVFFCWLPWILMAYPGTFCVDSIRQMAAYLSGDLANWTPHHPPLSNLLMGSLAMLGAKLGDINLGVFFYPLFQTLVGALVFAYGATVMRKELGIRWGYVVLCVLFYALAPMWGCFAQWYEKDLLYTCVAAGQTFLLVPILHRRHITVPGALGLLAISLAALLLRPNGICAVVPGLLALIFALRGRDRIRSSAVCAVALTAYLCVIYGLYPALGIRGWSTKESLSLPFQQTARWVRNYGDEVTDEEREAIDGVLNYDSLAERYSPRVSDPVKATYKNDSTRLRAYFKAWAKMGLRRPLCYLSASWNGGFGYLAPVAPNLEAPIGWKGLPASAQRAGDTLIEAGIPMKQVFRKAVQNLRLVRRAAIEYPVLRVLCMPGLYTWVLLLCLILVLKRKKYAALPALIPSVTTALTCLASPLANAIRYELLVVAAVPVLTAWSIFSAQESRDPAEGADPEIQ